MSAKSAAIARSPASGPFPGPGFVARDLDVAEIAYALPLVRATWPAMDGAAWQNFVGSFCADAASRPAITVLCDADGSFCGLFASRIEHRLGTRILAAPLFTAVDIGNSLAPVRALVAAIEARAAETGCAGIDIQLGKSQAGLRRRLLRLGGEKRGAALLDNVRPGLRAVH